MKNQPSEASAVLDSLRKLVRGLRLYSRNVESKFGLSGAQLFLLRSLHSAGPATVSELAKRTMTDVSSASEVCGRVQKKGLLRRRRSNEDRRSWLLSLTEKGQALLEKSGDALQEKLVAAVTELKPAERRLLATVLPKLIEKSGLGLEKPSMFFEDGS